MRLCIFQLLPFLRGLQSGAVLRSIIPDALCSWLIPSHSLPEGEQVLHAWSACRVQSNVMGALEMVVRIATPICFAMAQGFSSVHHP